MPISTDLTDKQHLAIEHLVAGKTDGEVAELVGVTRQTVNNWRHHNVAFVAELDTQRANLRASSADRLNNLHRKALDVVGDKLDQGDLDAAMFVLKLAGPEHLYARPTPPTLESVKMRKARQIQGDIETELFVPTDPLAVEIVEAEWYAALDPSPVQLDA